MRNIDANPIPFFDQGDSAAFRRLGRYVADRQAASAAAKPTIGQQGALRPKLLRFDIGSSYPYAIFRRRAIRALRVLHATSGSGKCRPHTGAPISPVPI